METSIGASTAGGSHGHFASWRSPIQAAYLENVYERAERPPALRKVEERREIADIRAYPGCHPIKLRLSSVASSASLNMKITPHAHFLASISRLTA